MDGVLDTADGECDGYHHKLDMPSCDYDAEVLAGTIPEITDDTTYGVLHCREIDDVIELCYKRDDGVWQMTDKGYVATDLDNWDSQTTISSFTVRSLIYVNGTYIAVGYIGNTGYIYTSTDLTTWTQRVSISNYLFFKVIYDGSYFYATAVTYLYNNSDGGYCYVYKSSNGISWTSSIVNVVDWEHLFSLASNSSIIVGVGWYIQEEEVGQDDYDDFQYFVILTSTNGTSWTRRIATGNRYYSRYLWDVCYGDSLFVAVGTYIYTSSDGITWTNRHTPAVVLYSVAYGDGLYVAVGTSGYIYTSSDGTTWTQRAALGYTLYSVTYSAYRGGLFVAIGASGKIYSSPDGITWTSHTSEISSALYSITQRDNYKSSGETFKNMFITAGDSGVVRTSKKGIKL